MRSHLGPLGRVQLIDEDSLRRAGGITFMASLAGGLSGACEIGRFEATAAPIWIHKGLDHLGPILITDFKVRDHPTQHPAQDMTGQIPASAPNQQSTQTADAQQVSPTFDFTPPHPRLPRCQTQAAGRKPDRTQIAVVDGNEVVQLGPDEPLRTP